MAKIISSSFRNCVTIRGCVQKTDDHYAGCLHTCLSDIYRLTYVGYCKGIITQHATTEEKCRCEYDVSLSHQHFTVCWCFAAVRLNTNQHIQYLNCTALACCHVHLTWGGQKRTTWKQSAQNSKVTQVFLEWQGCSDQNWTHSRCTDYEQLSGKEAGGC